MFQFEPDAVVEVDFNNLDANDNVVSSLRFLNRWRRPSIGEWVRLIDAEGNACIGQVSELRNLIAVVQPDWGTWTSGAMIPGFGAPVQRIDFESPVTR